MIIGNVNVEDCNLKLYYPEFMDLACHSSVKFMSCDH